MNAAIIQARMGSTRLPGKVLMDIEGRSMLQHICDRLEQSKSIDQISIATTTHKEDDAIVEFAESLNIHCFRGSSADVLSRFYHAAAELGANNIARICSDSPLIDINYLDVVMERHIKNKNDHTYMTDLPVGTGTAVIPFHILEELQTIIKSPEYREHVTIYLDHYPAEYKTEAVAPHKKHQRPEIRLTVDQSEDLELIRKIYRRLYVPGKIIELDDVIDLLDNEPELLQINGHVVQRCVSC